MNSFILIRHAESPWSEDDARPLSPSGVRAAEALPARLSAFRVDAIYSSPYRRAVQTAEPLARDRRLPIVEVPELRERTLGSVGHGSFVEAMAEGWKNRELAYAGGESSLAAQRRMVRVVRDLAVRHASQSVVLATHGNVLALLLNAFDASVGFEFWRGLEFPDVFELRLVSASEGVFRRVAGDAV